MQHMEADIQCMDFSPHGCLTTVCGSTDTTINSQPGKELSPPGRAALTLNFTITSPAETSNRLGHWFGLPGWLK